MIRNLIIVYCLICLGNYANALIKAGKYVDFCGLSIDIEDNLTEGKISLYNQAYDAEVDYLDEANSLILTRFQINHVQNSFYSIMSEKPGERFINSLKTTYTTTIDFNQIESDSIHVTFDFGILNKSKLNIEIKAGNYKKKISSVASNGVKIPRECDDLELSISPDEMILEESYYYGGMDNCIKFINLPQIPIDKPNLCNISIETDSLDEDVFRIWYIGGDLIKATETEIIWNNRIFKYLKI